MPLPQQRIIGLMKAVAWHIELGDVGAAAGIREDQARDWLLEHYPHATAYQRERALALATQAIEVGRVLREQPLQEPLRRGLGGARAPAAQVGVRVRLNLTGLGERPGRTGPPPAFTDRYIPMAWDQTVGDVGQAVREVLAAEGYTEAEIAAIEGAGARAGVAAEEAGGPAYLGHWWEFVGPTLFPISED